MTKNFADDFIINYMSASGDEIFITDGDGNILFKNQIASYEYKNCKNILKLSHLFNFEVCILNSDNIISYNPVNAALTSSENFSSSITKQTKENRYIEYCLSAFYIAENKKMFVLKNCENRFLQKNNTDLQEKLLNLTSAKDNVENQLIKSNLVNLISSAVREYIDTDKIIKIAVNEIKKTLSVTKIIFSKDISENKISSETDETNSLLKLTIPVFRDNNNYGALVLYKKNIPNAWTKDEIELLKNIALIITSAFVKEELYKQLEEQKTELEQTLIKLKDAQLQIVQSEKMAALGQLVAGVAHEINTPLGAISANLDLINMIAKNPKSQNDIMEIIKEIEPVNKEALRRIETMVKSLKNFARLDEAKKKKVNIIDGIQSSLNLLVHETKNRIKIIENYSDLPLISCYPDYVNQVFMNILLNACQSIDGNGEITITTTIEDDFAKVTISDTGCGIKPETLKRIFEFGFTTKKLGQGTGLGLALAKKIIDEHNGKIEVQSELQKGTTFSIYLPI